MMSRKILLLAGLSSLAMVQPAFAQDAAPTEEASDGGLEEIIVTAQKREQNLQNVPVSVTALGEAAIENNRIAEFSDLTRAASSLTITQSTSSPNNSIILRGIGTFAFSIGVEPSVAVIVDDLPVVQQAQAFDSLGDVQRIEVLKGPQGTLFGKNASAGVVNVVTKDPSNELSGRIAFTAATDDDYRAEAAISGPLGEGGSGFRLSGFFHDYKGNIRNLTLNRFSNDSQSYGLRGKIKLAATDKLDITLNGSWARTTQDGTTSSIRSINPLGIPRVLGNAALALLPSLTGITAGVDNRNARVDAPGGTKNETWTLSGRAVYDLGNANLILVTGYQDWKYNFQNDTDGTDLNVLSALTGGATNGGIAQSGPYHSTLFTQEVRIASSGNDPLSYIVGLFYADAKTDRAFSRGPVALLANWDATSSSKSYAMFGQLDYKFESGTTVSAGVRLNHEEIGVRFDNLLGNAIDGTCKTGYVWCRGTHDDEVLTWKGTISQDLAEDVMVYASVARGYKGFAYDVTSGFNPARIYPGLNGSGLGMVGVGPVKAETSTSYEAGIKSRFLDNKVQINLVGFVADYDNFQAQSAVLVNNAFQFVLNNVGKLKTKGFELEFSAKPSDWLRIDASAAYTDAVMTSFPAAQNYSDQTGATWNGTASVLSAPCIAAPVASALTPRTLCTRQDRSGATLPNSPKFKYTINAVGEFPFGDDNKAIVTLGWQHQSRVNFDLLGNPLLTQDAYGVFNASVGAEFGQGFKVTAFVNNLFDKSYAGGLSDGFQTLGGSATNPAHVIYQVLSRDADRYFGLKLGYEF
jgi:iron complex outermembrane receptor protein